MTRRVKGTVAGIIVLGIAGAGIAWYLLRGSDAAADFRTAVVKRGDLLVSISATGTVEPEEVIDVGAQIAGQIVSFGKDAAGRTVDYGSVVEEGMVLAKIDDSLYSADAAQAEAQVQSGRATLQRAEADLGQLRAKLHQAERDWQRAQKIGPSEALAEASFDAYKSAYESAVANLAVGQAAILQARASLAQAEALLRRAQRNLSYTTIKSPVKGVIIDRRVNIGQTVVASLNAPSLFLIAKDLKRMQVWVAVNEADIGKIHPGQPVSFTVDAFPGEIFRGEVGKVRLNASMTQNVVTYTVEVITDNSSGRLLPYLTANVQFELNRLTDVLLVPNAALRFRPAAELVLPEFRDALASAAEGKARPPEGPRTAPGPGVGGGASGGRSSLWLPAGEYVRPLAVKAGLSDGTMTEITGENLSEGLGVVTGVQLQAGSKADTSNPFTPSFSRGGSSAGAGRPR
ncbi:MAG: efflux RND transporter periplasmic adaptor subunit [Desulfobacterales bacterium]|jgi:HlyD family secretion protein|nr:efflux RND transporter periplasmic adaptor subunit [Desulfobacterales bacterium]